MKNLIIFAVFILALVCVQFAQGQSVDDVIEKYIAAMGGKDKLMALNTVVTSGNLSVQGADVVIVSTKKHNVGMRVDISVMGFENYQLVTPDKGWIYMPIQGQAAPEEMPEDQFKAGQNQLDLHGPFTDYKSKGTAVEMKGKETVDGKECYKLMVNFKNGQQMTCYIDTKDYRFVKTVTMLELNGESTEVANTYTDYKQNADGYWFAYSTTSSRGTTIYDKIETNVPVDDKIFKAN